MPENLAILGRNTMPSMLTDTTGIVTISPNTIINQAQGFASTAMVEVNSFTSRLSELATVSFSVPVPTKISSGVDFDMSWQALQEIEARRPTSPTISPITSPLPSSPDYIIDFEWSDATFIAELKAKVLAVLDYLDGNAYEIDNTDETALWERGRDKETKGMRDAIENAMEEYSAMGFSVPMGALKKTIDKTRLTTYANLGALNREITIKKSELYLERRKLIMDLEKTLVLYHSAFMKNELERANLIIAKYGAQLKAWEDELKLLQVNNELAIAKYKADVDGYVGEARAITGAFELGQKAREDEYRQIVNALNANSEIAKLDLSMYVEQARLRMEAAKTGADVYKNIAAAAIGSMHLSVGLNETASYGKTYSIGNSVHLQGSVSNSYSESKQLTDEYKLADTYDTGKTR
jgi:hypothetical protein